MVRSLFLVVTTRCNLRCAPCFIRPAVRGDMDIATAASALERLLPGEDGERIVTLTGGEPLLNWPVVAHILKRFCERGNWSFCLSTNGTLIDREKAARLRAHRVKVTLSLDGSPPEHPSGHCSSDAIRGLEALREEGVEPVVQMLVTSGSVARFSRDLAYILSLGVRSVTWNYGLDRTWKRSHAGALRRELLRIVELQRARAAEGAPFITPYLQEELDAYLAPRGAPRNNCTGAGETLAVDPGGSIYPCHGLVCNPAARLGSMQEGILPSRVKLFHEARNALPQPCRRCHLVSTCRRCPAVDEELRGSLPGSSGLVCAVAAAHHAAAASMHHIRQQGGIPWTSTISS